MSNIATLGTDLYYSLLRFPTEKRQAVVDLHTFFQAVTDIPLQISEEQVALAKLQWWQQEIDRLITKEATHPLALALSQHRFPIKPLRELITTTIEQIRFCQFDNFEELTIHIMRTFGVREKLMANIFSSKVDEEIIYQCALCLALTDYAKRLRIYIRHSFFMFPNDEMQSCEVSRSDLLAYKTTPNIEKLFALQHSKINHAFSIIKRHKRQLPKPLYKQCKLAFAWWKLAKSEHYRVLEQKIMMAPIWKLATTLCW